MQLELNYQPVMKNYLLRFSLNGKEDLFKANNSETKIEFLEINHEKYPKFINEYWTSKQRQSNSIHEITYRACFKPELPRFFINLLTKPRDIVFDPFSGRGTTVLEAGLLNRNIISNDINPISKIITQSRFFIPELTKLEERLNSIPVLKQIKSDIDLSMFYHVQTLKEILSIREYLKNKKETKKKDDLDMWIRMVATNRLTGHSKGFFSVYSLPPNQAVSPEGQVKINEKLKQTPEYKDTKKIILKKSWSLIRDITSELKERLKIIGRSAIFLSENAAYLNKIKDNTVQLIVTSPPFLDIVQYADDNRMRCWFNNIDTSEIESKITMSKKIEDWCNIMQNVFYELFRITRPGGYVAFEVGELRNGKIKLDEFIVPIGLKAGFHCEGIMINQQVFTKTSNIWGVSNNKLGTNTNRIVIFTK